MRRAAAWRSALGAVFASWCVSAQLPPGSPFQVSPSPRVAQGDPVIAATQDGGLLIAWRERDRAGEGSRLVVRRWDAGSPGPEQTVARTAGILSQPVLASDLRSDPAILIGWREDGAIRVGKLSAAGALEGGTLPVTTCCAGGFDLAVEDDGFVAVWEEIPSSLGGHATVSPSATLKGQRFRWLTQPEPADTKILETGLNGNLTGDSAPPRIQRVNDGPLLVTWQRGGVKGNVFLRAFEADWQEIPLPLLAENPGSRTINRVREGLQRRPALAARGLGDLRELWESGPPRVEIDLAVCLNGGRLSAQGAGGSGSDTLGVALAGLREAIADRRVIPADGTVLLSILLFGSGGLESLRIGDSREASASLADSGAAGQVVGRIGDFPLAAERQELGSSAARCLCVATRLLTGDDPCPAADADLCAVPPQEPAPPANAAGPRKVALLATGSLSLSVPPVSPFHCEPTAAAASCQLRGAARLALHRGVTTMNVLRLGDSGAELQRIADCVDARPQESRIDLGVAAFADPGGGEGGFVSEAREVAEVAQALGRTLAAEEGAESGIFARFLTPGQGSLPEIQVNSAVAGSQAAPDVALDPDGTALVVWEDRRNGRIAAQFFDPTGERRGAETEVSAGRVFARHPRVVALGPGRFAVSWEQTSRDGEPPSIWARLLGPPVARVGGPR